MGAQTDIVEVSLTTVAARASQAGFGVPLVISYNATFPERVRSYSAAADLVADGMAITTPEYLAVAEILSQNPSLPSVMIGRGALKPTQVYTLTPTVANSTIYSGSIDGVAWTFTSDSSATLAEICTGISAAIDAAIGATFTLASTGTTVTATAATAGNWTSIVVDNIDLIKVQLTHADPGIATDLAAIRLENDTWYALVTTQNSSAIIAAAAAVIETLSKIYIPRSSDTECATHVLTAATDIAATLKTSAYQRTALLYHHVPAQHADAAWVGRRLPLDPGTENWMFATLAGVSASPLTTAHKTNLDAKNANGYYNVFGANQTFKGVCAAGAPYFIDYVRFRDLFVARIGEGTFDVLSQDEKLPMSNVGLLTFKNAWLAVCRRFEKSGALVAGASVVTVPDISDVPSADRAARIASGSVIDVTYSGAVNHVKLSVRVTI
jgi:hypothetical protein